MPSTYKTRDEFLDAMSLLLQEDTVAPEIHSAVLSGISSADHALGSHEESESQAFHLRVGSWVIRDDDVPILHALNTTATAVVLSLTAAGLPWAAIATALTSLADVCWRIWRKGGRLSPQQVSVYGELRALGPSTCESLLNHLRNQGTELSSPALERTLLSLTEIELNDGRIIPLAAKDAGGSWKALNV